MAPKSKPRLIAHKPRRGKAPKTKPKAKQQASPIRSGAKTPNLKPGSKAWHKRMAELGLPVPQDASRSNFIKQQNKYYKTLAKAGFEDIEWLDPKTGRGQNSDVLKKAAIRRRMWRPEKAHFYRLLRNYVTHAKFKTKRQRLIMEMLADGISYRRVLKAVIKQSHGMYKKSLYTFFYECQPMLTEAMLWNKTDPEGMLNPANQDSWATDVLLADMGLDTAIGQDGEAYLGLALDHGWMQDNMPKRDDSY